MTRPLNRWKPVLPVGAMKTFQITNRTRPATCAEVNCAHHLKGWASTVIAGSEDEALLRASKRKFLIDHAESHGGFIRFIFPPGQICFRYKSHRLPLEEEAIHVVRDGDWRGNPTGRRTQLRADQWLESFQESTDDITTRKARG